MIANKSDFREGYHEHGAVICNGCNTRVDLSEADDIPEAVDLWNEHVEENHASDRRKAEFDAEGESQ